MSNTGTEHICEFCQFDMSRLIMAVNSHEIDKHLDGKCVALSTGGQEIAPDLEELNRIGREKQRREQNTDSAARLLITAVHARDYIIQNSPNISWLLDGCHGAELLMDGLRNAVEAVANGEEWRTNRWYRSNQDIQNGTGIRAHSPAVSQWISVEDKLRGLAETVVDICINSALDAMRKSGDDLADNFSAVMRLMESMSLCSQVRVALAEIPPMSSSKI
jgi:hypothetical protein